MSKRSRQSILRRKLREFRRKQKLQRKFNQAKNAFKTRKKEKESFVFVDTKGKRRNFSSRSVGFLFYIDSRGRKHVVKRKGETSPIPRSQTEYDITSQRKKKAIGKWERKLSLYQLGRVKSLSTKGALSNTMIGKRLSDATSKFYASHKGRPLLVIEMATTAKVGRRVKVIRSQFQLSQAQITELKKGNTKFLHALAWKQLSIEMSVDDLVSQGSAEYIERLKINKGRKKNNFLTKYGEKWGKSGYKKVQIKRVDFKFKTTSRR